VGLLEEAAAVVRQAVRAVWGTQTSEERRNKHFTPLGSSESGI